MVLLQLKTEQLTDEIHSTCNHNQRTMAEANIVMNQSVTINQGQALSNDCFMAVKCFGPRRHKVSTSPSCTTGFFRRWLMRKERKVARKMKREERENVEPREEAGQLQQVEAVPVTIPNNTMTSTPVMKKIIYDMSKYFIPTLTVESRQITTIAQCHQIEIVQPRGEACHPKLVEAVPATVLDSSNTMMPTPVLNKTLYDMSKYYIARNKKLRTNIVTSVWPASTAVTYMTPRVKRTHITTVAQCHGAQPYSARRDQPDSSDRVPVNQTCTGYTEVPKHADGTAYAQDTLNNESTKHSQVASYTEGTEYAQDTLYIEGTQHIQVHSHLYVALHIESFLETAQPTSIGQYVQAATARPCRLGSGKAARGCRDRMNRNRQRNPSSGKKLVSTAMTHKGKRAVGKKLRSFHGHLHDMCCENGSTFTVLADI